MAFLDDVIFPENVSYGSRGGPEYNTVVILLNSGYEDRAALHEYPKNSYDAAFGIMEFEDELAANDGLEDVIATFHVASGKFRGFKYKDHGDYKSCSYLSVPAFTDIQFGTGDGIETVFYLKKIYTKGAISKIRLISKPKNTTILIGNAGAPQTETTHYTIDYTTGAVTFVTPPANTNVLTWGGEFYVPVRFDSDNLDIVLSHYQAGNCTIPLMEIKV